MSVLIASYNYEAYLGEALACLQRQSYAHFEAVICDDGSTDGSRAVAARFVERDARFRLLAKENGGVASALNAAYAACQGHIIALLDADDTFAPDKLARVVAGLQHNAETGLVLHAMHIIDGQGHVLRSMPSGGTCEQGWLAEPIQARGGRWRAMPASALAFHRDVADRLFPIPEATFRSEADGFLTTLAGLLTAVAFIPETLAQYRLHGANLTGTLTLNQDVMVRRLDAQRRQNKAVNARLAALGMAERQFALEDNVNYHEQAFMLAAFQGASRRSLFNAYGPLCRVLLTDDLYGWMRKVGGVIVYGIALTLPVPMREPWINRMLGARTLRRMLRGGGRKGETGDS